jgi:hypothetical protein
MPNTDRVALTALSRELTALTGTPGPGYRRLYSMTVDDRLPAEQDNGRWFFRRSDLPAIAGRLGLSVKETAAASVAG